MRVEAIQYDPGMRLTLACLIVSLSGCASTAPKPTQRPAAAAVPKASRHNTRQVLQRACDKGNARSCYVLGLSAPKQRRRGYLQQACAAGHAEACAQVGRAMPFSATVRGAVTRAWRLQRFKAVSVGRVLGPDADRVRAALKGPLKERCDCIVGSTEDIDLLPAGELLISGLVLAHPAAAGERAGAAEAAMGRAIAGRKAKASSAEPRLPRLCQGAAVAVKFYLLDDQRAKTPLSVLAHARAGGGPCRAATDAAIAAMARDFVARLSDSFSQQLTLYRDPGLPRLQQGNKQALMGDWHGALGYYQQALALATGQDKAACRARALYSTGLALAQLDRYPAALAALKQAAAASPGEPAVQAALGQLAVIQAETWSAPPPVDRRTAAPKKRKLFWQPGLRRKVVWQ